MIVTDEAFPYLVAQQGKLDHLKTNRLAWEEAYGAGLDQLLAEISPHLPAACTRILDVGGGMGGIDALLVGRYGDACDVSILDGLTDSPVVERHCETFSNIMVCRRFLEANGVRRLTGIPPSLAKSAPSGRNYDLVVSFASWCFHYPPSEYLDFVRARCHPDTVVIVEVRSGRPDWLGQLIGSTWHGPFAPVAGQVFDKFTRWVLKPNPNATWGDGLGEANQNAAHA